MLTSNVVPGVTVESDGKALTLQTEACAGKGLPIISVATAMRTNPIPINFVFIFPSIRFLSFLLLELPDIGLP
jgi:hypothetical protein